MRSDLKKLDSFTLEISKNYLIRSFLRNGRLRVNEEFISEKELHNSTKSNTLSIGTRLLFLKVSIISRC